MPKNTQDDHMLTFKADPLSIRLGKVETPYHNVRVKVKTLADSFHSEVRTWYGQVILASSEDYKTFIQ